MEKIEKYFEPNEEEAIKLRQDINKNLINIVNNVHKYDYGIGKPTGDQYKAELIINLLNSSETDLVKRGYQMYDTEPCWPKKIPIDLVYNAIRGYSMKSYKLYNMLFVKNITYIKILDLLSSMDMAQDFSYKRKLKWMSAPVTIKLSKMKRKNKFKYIYPPDYLNKIDIDEYALELDDQKNVIHSSKYKFYD